jgi:hypothetical protein
MAAKSAVVRKNYRLDQAQIARAQKALGAVSETETITRALDLVLSEAARNRVTLEANRQFLASGIRVRDVFGSLSK